MKYRTRTHHTGYREIVRSTMGPGRYQMESRAIVSKVLGRELPTRHPIHHVNENKADNRNANLCVLESTGEHNALHRRRRVQKAGGDPWRDRICAGPCHLPLGPEHFSATSRRCRTCENKRMAIRRAKRRGIAA